MEKRLLILMIKFKYLFVIGLFIIVRTCYSQDTCLYRYTVDIIDTSLVTVMDSVLNRASECFLFTDIPFFVEVKKIDYTDGAPRIEFSVVANNATTLLHDELFWGNNWCYCIHDRVIFIFFYEDTAAFGESKKTKINISKNQWFSIEYLKKYETVQFPLLFRMTYNYPDYSLIHSRTCENYEGLEIYKETKNRIIYGPLTDQKRKKTSKYKKKRNIPKMLFTIIDIEE